MPQVQIQILNGIYCTTAPDIRTAYPINLYPCPKQSGISSGYLRPGEGIVEFSDGYPGSVRGGIVFNNRLYYVMGDQIFRINSDGTNFPMAGIGTNNRPVSMTYGFDYMCTVSDGIMYMTAKDETTSTSGDPDIPYVIDAVWIDGYFMFTDGVLVGVTDLNDPFNFNPQKYTQSEADPDPVVALKTIRNEVYVINRNTIEVLDNVGGAGFPFARIEGAQIEKGAAGTKACCVFMEQIAFLGSGVNEQNAIYLGANGSVQKISTQEIDMILTDFDEEQLSESILEQRNYGSHWFLYVHLDGKTFVYDAGASQELQTPVWFQLSSGDTELFGIYRGRFFVWAFDRWMVGDTSEFQLGYLTEDISSHWGEPVRWQFQTPIVYNEGNGAIFNRLELVPLAGSYELGAEPTVTTTYSVDGVTWATGKSVTISAGTTGQRTKRIAWFQQGWMQNWRIQRFHGTSEAHMAFARLQADLEPLAW